MLLHWRVWGCKWGSCAITPVWRNPGGGAEQTAVCLFSSALPESVEKCLRRNKTGRSEDDPVGPSSSAGDLSCSNTSMSLSHCCKLFCTHSTHSAYWWYLKRWSHILIVCYTIKGANGWNWLINPLSIQRQTEQMATSSQRHMETNDHSHIYSCKWTSRACFRTVAGRLYTQREHTRSTQKSLMPGIKPATCLLWWGSSTNHCTGIMKPETREGRGFNPGPFWRALQKHAC